MINIVFWIYIFLDLLSIIVIIDVILKWLFVFWINLRPKFIADIMDPIYFYIKKIIPTTFWPIDFTPIIIILITYFIKWLLIIIFPDLSWILQLYTSIIK
jgi:uncharacterized protein YggT (Ycf19 family)